MATCSFMSHQPPSVHDFHSSSSQRLSSEPIYLLGQNLFLFYHSHQISERLRKLVSSPNATQIIWFRKLIDAWKNSEQVPQTTKEISELIIKALKEHPKDEVKELLHFYGLPLPHTTYTNDRTSESLPEGVKLELQTLPVDARAVADGDTITVYVRASHVLETSLKRKQARAIRNYAEADALDQEIINSEHCVIKFQNEEFLGHKYRIRLRGIDAPESQMPYGKEATDELIKIIQGRSLRIHVYDIDCYGRLVGDIYCDTIFVQELLLKKGCAWYYSHYDKREELRNWENEAKKKKVGLWSFPNPEEPWEWRKKQRNAMPPRLRNKIRKCRTNISNAKICEYVISNACKEYLEY